MMRQRKKAIVHHGHGIRRWQRGAQKLGLWVLVGFILLASIVCRESLGKWDMMGKGNDSSLSQSEKNGTMSETSGRQDVVSQDGQIITADDEGLTQNVGGASLAGTDFILSKVQFSSVRFYSFSINTNLTIMIYTM